MYIGPWQEYKLARLIQNQHQALAREVAQEVIRQRAGASRPNSSRGALASPTCSQRSGFSGSSGISTQSAPAQLPQPSAQVRLNDYCDSAERASQASDRRRRWAPPRPGAASGSSTGSTRPCSASSSALGGRGSTASLSGIPPLPRAGASAIKRKAGCVGGGAKKSGKPPQAASFEEQRRARIRHMQKLYGLGDGDDGDAAPREQHQEQPSHPGGGGALETSSAATAAVAGSFAAIASQASNDRGQDDRTSEVDNAISRLQSSIQAHESADVTTKLPLPSLPEDPLGASMDMGGSGGLIEWSKNLHPDDLSPQATLASFFPT